MSHLSQRVIVHALAAAAGRWRERTYPRRRLAIGKLRALTGLAPAMLHEGFDHLFAGFDPELLRALTTDAPRGVDHTESALPARWLLIVAGNVPGLALPDLTAVLLAGSACLVRPSSRDPLTLALFIETLIELEPRLADRLALVQWPRADAAATREAAASADGVIASGDDETIAALAPHARRLIGYGHRRSVALIGAEALAAVETVADRLARDICFYEQQGCLSPQVAYVEEGGPVTARDVARQLAAALRDHARRWPPAPVPLEAAGAILQLRGELEFRADGAAVLSSTWGSVLYDPAVAPRPSPGYRTIWVKPVAQLEQAIDALGAWRGRIESVGLALPPARTAAIGPQIDTLGASRCCPIGTMQTPPLRWRLIDQGLLTKLMQWNHIPLARIS
jgi:hypothetical protein